LASSPERGVTVFDPAASRTAALVIGASFCELLLLELLEDEDEGLPAFAFASASARALALARSFSLIALASASGSEGGLLDPEDDEEEEDILVVDEVEEDEEGLAVTGSGGGFNSCETSWIENSKSNRNPRVLFTKNC
jgi:hypothetical protein